MIKGEQSKMLDKEEKEEVSLFPITDTPGGVGTMPEISVIVPIYNIETYLRRCVDSILNQTFTDFELILVDDGSQDSSGSICEEYAEKDKRIKVIHKENGGAYSARNAGLDTASGTYVMFVDGDDFLVSDALSAALSTADEYKADYVHYYYSQYGADGVETDIRDGDGSVKQYVSSEERFAFLLDTAGYKTGGWNVWTCLFKSETVKRNSLRFIPVFAEDIPFALSLICYSCRIADLNRKLYFYDVSNASSITHRSKKSFRIDGINEGLYSVAGVYQNTFKDEHYCQIHYSVIMLHMMEWLSGFVHRDTMKKLDCAIQGLRHKKFFAENNRLYLEREKNADREETILIRWKRRIINDYLISLNYGRLIGHMFFWNTAFCFYCVVRKAFRIFKALAGRTNCPARASEAPSSDE